MPSPVETKRLIAEAQTNTALVAPTVTTSLTLLDAANVIVSAVTGSKIGTAASQKLGFWNAAPITQPADAAQGAVVATVGADIGAFTDPPSAAEMALLRTFANALKADNAALIVLVNRLRLDAVSAGLIKGAA